MDPLSFSPIAEVVNTPATSLFFLLCVAVATYVQTLTGFAFGLVLLSLVATFNLASVADAANTATVLTLINAVAFFRAERQAPPWKLMRPALIASLMTVLVGVLLLRWISNNASSWLENALGVAIVVCAISLVARKRQAQQVGPPSGFAMAGALSGLMGGLFGTSGPPIVYHLYRQPLATDVVRRALLVMFASNAGMRLVLVVLSIGMTPRALLLSALAVPVVHITTRLTLKAPPPVPARVMRPLVAGLLALTGVAMVAR